MLILSTIFFQTFSDQNDENKLYELSQNTLNAFEQNLIFAQLILKMWKLIVFELNKVIWKCREKPVFIASNFITSLYIILITWFTLFIKFWSLIKLILNDNKIFIVDSQQCFKIFKKKLIWNEKILRKYDYFQQIYFSLIDILQTVITENNSSLKTKHFKFKNWKSSKTSISIRNTRTSSKISANYHTIFCSKLSWKSLCQIILINLSSILKINDCLCWYWLTWMLTNLLYVFHVAQSYFFTYFKTTSFSNQIFKQS